LDIVAKASPAEMKRNRWFCFRGEDQGGDTFLSMLMITIRDGSKVWGGGELKEATAEDDLRMIAMAQLRHRIYGPTTRTKILGGS
jgi:hypothetical protein